MQDGRRDRCEFAPPRPPCRRTGFGWPACPSVTAERPPSRSDVGDCDGSGGQLRREERDGSGARRPASVRRGNTVVPGARSSRRRTGLAEEWVERAGHRPAARLANQWT